MPIHNQQNIIGNILKSIYLNSSENVKEMFLIIDGCSDNTLQEVEKNIDDKIKTNIIITNNLFEIKCCNIGYKMSNSEYILDIQADMLILERDFDKRLLKPFEVFDNLLAVSGRDAADVTKNGSEVDFINLVGRDRNPDRNKFFQRMIVNRGPILINHKKIKELEYLDETFCPITQDDTDLCLRGLEKGYITGAYIIDYKSELSWGSTRKTKYISDFVDMIQKENMKKLIDRHYNALTDSPPAGMEYEL